MESLTRPINERIDMSMILARQIVELLSAAQASRNIAESALNAVQAHLNVMLPADRV
jgi:hypothetical protein